MGWLDFDIFWDCKFNFFGRSEPFAKIYWPNNDFRWWVFDQFFPGYFPTS